MNKHEIHLIGNAHLDPVWLWRFPEGLAEIKATFKAAIDRINEHDEFIFTSACAFYYKWVEENCPKLFEDIKKAVKDGRWAIVGGMWIQPDCNIPSSESFARHFLYSQNYFKEKFGITVKTGYNVDTFGHSAGLPRLLNEGGINNYVYMRPYHGKEMQYPFKGQSFIWKSGENEVLTSRISTYGGNLDEKAMADTDNYVDENQESIMRFYGCGNHGGGPTVRTIMEADKYMEKARNIFIYSDPDKYMKHIKDNYIGELPTFEGELQNHASGCYSANSQMKKLNRLGENRLNEAERMEVLSNALLNSKVNPEKNAEAWQNVLFNQFHDIICGCSMEEAYNDAYAFANSSIAHGLKLTNEAVQRIAWDIDTAKGISTLSKDKDWIVWDSGETGAPIVIFNPLSHDVTIPVWAHRPTCTAVKDDEGNFVPYQIIRASWTNGKTDKYCVRFLAKVPAFGYRTYWTFDNENVSFTPDSSAMSVTKHSLSNGVISVKFDKKTGNIASVTDNKGNSLIGSFASKAVVIDDSINDTWAHNQFVFDNVIGEFTDPTFEICENGACEVSLKITKKYKESKLTETYTLLQGEDRIRVSAELFMANKLIQVKLLFDSGIKDAEFTREVPGGIVKCETNGREEPMQRFMIAEKDGKGIAVINDCKYSSSIKDGVLGFIAARSCYFADHFAVRDQRMRNIDMGEQKFKYEIMPFENKLSKVVRAAEEINTEFPVILETYHYGSLPEKSSSIKLHSDNITVSALKPAENGKGYIVRITEIDNKEADFEADILGIKISSHVKPLDILTFRLYDNKAVRVNFLEEEV